MMMKRSAAAALAVAGLFLVAGCASASVVEEPEAVETPSAAQAPAVELPPLEVISEPKIGPGNPAEQDLVFASAPVSVTVPSLNIDMPVLAMGLLPDKEMEIPTRINDAGWYKYGAAPNSPEGAVVIAAHVDMPGQGIGPFAALREAQVGAEAAVTDEDGVTHTYRVTSVERIPKAEVPLDQLFADSGPNVLKLVTCGGSFDRNAGSYSDNYIVTAEKVS